MQDRVYRQQRLRIDTSSIYIRNAIEDPSGKPEGNQVEWPAPVVAACNELRLLLEHYRPTLFFCFGAFSFEFSRRARGQLPARPYASWGARTLGDAFRQSIDGFSPDNINAFPLLHTSISRGRYIESHNYFSGQDGANYFEYVGTAIADKLLQYRTNLQVWIP